MNKTHYSPEKIQVAYATIDLSWLPIVSITLSVVTILFSFLKTATHIFEDITWYLRNVIFLSIFIFRITTWVCLVIILVEIIFIPFVVVGITNAAVLLIVQKNHKVKILKMVQSLPELQMASLLKMFQVVKKLLDYLLNWHAQ